MFKLIAAITLGSAAVSANAFGSDRSDVILIAQANEPSQAPRPTMPPLPANLPPGIGPQGPAFPDAPGAGVPVMPRIPGAGASRGAGAQPVPPPMNEPIDQTPPRNAPAQSTPSTTSPGLITFLDSLTPFVQAFDFVLMIIAGIFCVRVRKRPGLTILAISCFLSAIILLGFFLFGVLNGHGLFAQSAYIVARLLAPFELLLFVVAIVIIARPNPPPA
jgi:hypothetical protein